MLTARQNTVFCGCATSDAVEVTPAKQVLWESKVPEKTEAHACQPLADGRVLVVEGEKSRIIAVDRAGKIGKKIELTTAAGGEPSVGEFDWRFCNASGNQPWME